MIVQAIGFEGEKLFKFYTYHPNTGVDMVIGVWAEDEEAAWTKFDRTYGKDCPVDKVVAA